MAEVTNISWCHHTFNPWIGCSKVSDGCKNCYAESLMDHRYHRVKWGEEGTRSRTSPKNWSEPLAWDRAAKRAGERRRVFCASLADVFEDRAELVEWRRDLFKLISATPNLDWLLLTKRPKNIVRMWPTFPDKDHGRDTSCGFHYFPNVWLGTSVENQAMADLRVPSLLDAKSMVGVRIAFLSCEPLLDAVDVPMEGIDWVIVGGESGKGARPMHPDWARSLRDQCGEAGVPFHFKQWGEWFPRSQWEDNPELVLALLLCALCEVGRRWRWRRGKGGAK